MNENGTLAHTFKSFTRQLSEIETRCAGTNTIETSIFDELLGATHDLFQTCYDYERRASAEEIAQAQEQFREITTPWFSKSYFMQRARVWPRGYPGDFETLEAVYHGVPRSEDHFGRLLDVYFLTRQLALAVRERRLTLVDLLTEELSSRQSGARILNVACGSCRELFDVASILRERRPAITCADHDTDALAYAGLLLASNAISPQTVRFKRYNAYRLTNATANLREFGSQDLIYSAGLFDYIKDEPLVRILITLFELLNANGKLIVPFKDCQRYQTGDYHWLVNWSHFYQRTEPEIDALFQKAGIGQHAISKQRDRTGTIIFYTVEC